MCSELLNAKYEESLANEKRVEIERQIIEIVGSPEEGSSTTSVNGYKIKVDQRIIRKLDTKKWAVVSAQIPEELRPVTVVTELKVEAKGVRWLKDNEAGYYRLLCTAMEEKPAKTAVKVEVDNK